jgi:hypothetical protein
LAVSYLGAFAVFSSSGWAEPDCYRVGRGVGSAIYTPCHTSNSATCQQWGAQYCLTLSCPMFSLWCVNPGLVDHCSESPWPIFLACEDCQCGCTL